MYKTRVVFNSNEKQRRSTKIKRIVLIIFIVLGLVYSIYSMFRRRDVFVSLKGLIEDGKFKRVEKLIEKRYKADPLNIKTLRLMGENYFLQAMRVDHVKDDQTEEGWELYKKAVKSLKKAILLDKTNSINSKDYFIIGFSYLKKGDAYFKNSIKFLKLAEEKNKNDRVLSENDSLLFRLESLYKLLGYIFYKTAKYNKAIQYYKMANKNKSVLNYLYIGLSLKHMNKFKKAITLFNVVNDYANTLELKTKALYNLAWLNHSLGNFKLSKKYYLKCIAINTNFAEGYYWLGKMEEKSGKQKNAVSLWKKCLDIDPNFGPAILKLAYLRRNKKKR